MLVSVSREDAARLLFESVRYGLGRSGFVVGAVCDAGEQLLRALTIEEADAIAATIAERAAGGVGALGEQGDEDRWLRLGRQLHDRTIVGAPEQVPIIDRDLTVLCACVEQRADRLDAAAREDAQALVARCRLLLPPEEQAVLDDLDFATPVAAESAGHSETAP